MDLALSADGALSRYNGTSHHIIPESEYYNEATTKAIVLNASLSSNRYGNYTEVNPLYESVFFYIKY